MHTGLEHGVSNVILDRWCAGEGFKPAEPTEVQNLRILRYGKTYRVLVSCGVVFTFILGTLIFVVGCFSLLRTKGNIAENVGVGISLLIFGAAILVYVFFGAREIYFTDIFLSEDGVHRRRGKSRKPLMLHWERIEMVSWSDVDHALNFRGVGVGRVKVSRYRRGFQELVQTARAKLKNEQVVKLAHLVKTKPQLAIYYYR